MKCPQCGQWNRASFPRCIKCGFELTTNVQEPSWKSQLKDDKGKEFIRVDDYGDAVTLPDEREVLAREMQELKERKQEGYERKRRMLQHSAQREASAATQRTQTMHGGTVFPRQEEDPHRAVRIVREGDRMAERQPEQAWPGFEAGYDPMAEAGMRSQRYYMNIQTPQEIRMPSRHAVLRRFIRVLTWLMAVCVVALVVFLGYQAIRLRQESISDKTRATVTASIVDDHAAHTILIPGEDGQQIYIKELHAAYIVTGGFATVELADHIWYEDLEELKDEAMSVTLTPYVKTASGQQKPLDTITYDISIPLSPITLLTPDSLSTEVTTAMYSMQFVVRPGSTVTINGKNVSDTVSAETGELTYNATVQPIGDNKFDIVVRSQYCRENTLQVVLYREVQDIPLDLAADTYTSTSASAIEIRATTLPGASVEILTPHTDLKITELDTTGKFSFMAVFDHIGNNTISITASYPGRKTSRVDYIMYYVPNQDVYTRKAWPLNSASDYSELVANIRMRAERTQIYEVVGTIAEIVSDKPQMAIVYTSDDGKNRPVLLENKSKTTWNVGDYFRIYADAYGTYDAMPWLIARYTYK